MAPACTSSPAPMRAWSSHLASGRWPTTCSSAGHRRRSDRTQYSVVVGVVESSEPGGQALDRDLELGIEVDELPKSLGDPGQAQVLCAATRLQLFDSAVGEVHRSSQCRGDELALLLLVPMVATGSW